MIVQMMVLVEVQMMGQVEVRMQFFLSEQFVEPLLKLLVWNL